MVPIPILTASRRPRFEEPVAKMVGTRAVPELRWCGKSTADLKYGLQRSPSKSSKPSSPIVSCRPIDHKPHSTLLHPSQQLIHVSQGAVSWVDVLVIRLHLESAYSSVLKLGRTDDVVSHVYLRISVYRRKPKYVNYIAC